MTHRAHLAIWTFAPLLLLQCAGCPINPNPAGTGGAPAGGSVSAGGTAAVGGDTPVAGAPAQAGGAPSDGGLAACIAYASASEGVRNVAAKSGVSLASAVAEICSSPALRNCYAAGRCK